MPSCDYSQSFVLYSLRDSPVVVTLTVSMPSHFFEPDEVDSLLENHLSAGLGSLPSVFAVGIGELLDEDDTSYSHSHPHPQPSAPRAGATPCRPLAAPPTSCSNSFSN